MKRHLCAACLAAYFAFSSVQPVGALTVFDPSNYSQNVLQAARALQQINNQIQSLQNQVLMLQNMAQNLQRLDYSSLGPIVTALRNINLLMARAQGIAFQVDSTEREFARLYPKHYAATVTTDALARDARGRWEHSMDALRQTMLLQEIGSAHVCTPVTNAHLVCRLLPAQKHTQQHTPQYR